MEHNFKKAQYLNDAANQIAAQFQDIVEPKPSSSLTSAAATVISTATVDSTEVQSLGNIINSDGNGGNSENDGQDWEWVEETEHVILDFGCANFNAEDMERLTSQGYNLIGLDTPTPFFRAGGYVFKGFYEDTAVTEDMVFKMKDRDEVEEDADDGEIDTEDTTLDLLSIITKRLVFEAVELFPNAAYDSEVSALGMAKGAHGNQLPTGDGHGDNHDSDDEKGRSKADHGSGGANSMDLDEGAGDDAVQRAEDEEDEDKDEPLTRTRHNVDRGFRITLDQAARISAQKSTLPTTDNHDSSR
ncbi:hypothetical protein BGW38_004270 [Lunasporangiospora selenospora]|uniref:Transcription factor TFIIIC triple barrel domain-containing protein n=1 Tax=Lunasporangiospora selenospora TaxID=979761 RepID=A0A9P6G0U7_9FUNG|nr:hypothetical protein BGW38_004270 [Lunasporangiospora selenospora]